MSDRSHAPTAHPHARSAGGFGIVAGVAMLLIWAYLLATGDVHSLEPRPLGTWLHIAGEVVTALFLIAAGWGLLTGAAWARKLFLLANGMLLLAVIHAIAWYGQRGEVGMVFAVFAVGVLAVFFAIRSEE